VKEGLLRVALLRLWDCAEEVVEMRKMGEVVKNPLSVRVLKSDLVVEMR